MPATQVTIYSSAPAGSPSGRLTLRGNELFFDEQILLLPPTLPAANQALSYDGNGSLFWQTVAASSGNLTIVNQTVGIGTPADPVTTSNLYQYLFDNIAPATTFVVLPTLAGGQDGFTMFIKNSRQSLAGVPFEFRQGAGNTLEGELYVIATSGLKTLGPGDSAELVWDNANTNWMIV